MNLSLEQESSEGTSSWIWKQIWTNFKNFLQSNLLLESRLFVNIQNFHHEFIIRVRKLWSHFLWIWKPNFDEFQRLCTVKPLARNLNLCKYSNFSWWINHYSNEALKAILYDSESQNLTNFKDFFTVKPHKPLDRNMNFANIQIFHDKGYDPHEIGRCINS